MGYGALIAAAAGAALHSVNEHQVAQQQDEQAAQGIRIQAADQQKADDQVGQNIKNLQQSTPETARANAASAFLSQLRRNSTAAIGSGTVKGGSARYNTDVNDASQNVLNYGANLADTQSRIMAPQLQRQQEGQNAQQLASNIGEIGRQSAANEFLTKLRMRGVVPNPWVDAASSSLSGYSGALASNYKG
jgi:F0F1-type ATP synthase membrane subunit b/b'